jgi:D-hexose-6-phosphate mutarotase
MPINAKQGRVAILDGQGDLPMLGITTPWSTAEIYMHGAHVTHFRKNHEPPLLFVSQCSRFEAGHPIRGGVPIIFPWFGSREGLPNHGFARLTTWEFREVGANADGSVSVKFQLPFCPEASAFPPFSAEYRVIVSDVLTLELMVTNDSDADDFVFESCLHSYFEVSDATAISIHGLQGARYLDQVAKFAEKVDPDPAIRIAGETDRIYLDTTAAVELQDPRLGRKILVEKAGSKSTIVWNPWTTKSQQMPDFGNEEYLRMVCVESGNVAGNEVKLPPKQSATLAVKLSSAPLA